MKESKFREVYVMPKSKIVKMSSGHSILAGSNESISGDDLKRKEQFSDVPFTFIALAAMLMLASCSMKEEPKADEQLRPGKEWVFEAAIKDESEANKTVVQSDGTSVWWSANEEINVFYGDRESAKFVSQNSEPVETARFKGTLEYFSGDTEGTTSPGIWAVYPYSAENSSDGESVTTTLSPWQTACAESFADRQWLTLARAENLFLSFRAVCAGFRFSVTKEGVKSVTFKGNNDEVLAGRVKLAMDGNGCPVILNHLTQEKEITLSAPAGQTLRTETLYYMTFFPANFTGGFTVTFKTETQQATVVYSEAKDFRRTQVHRGVDFDKDAVYTDIPEEEFAGGTGTSTDPYLIANERHLENMMKLYRDSEAPSDKNSFKYWFKMTANVDASGIEWTPINNSGSFYKAIDFDGGGYTISSLTTSGTYAGFAGVLYGSVRNVTFDGAVIGGTTKKGVVAAFLGTEGIPASCENVIVKNSTVTGGNFSGGFAGHVRTIGSVENCSVQNTTVTSTSGHVGGFAAYADISGTDRYEVPVRFVNCHVTDVTVNQDYATAGDAVVTGGFIACANTGAGFTGCTVKATVLATKAALKDVGGFIGRASYACPTFKDCQVLPGSVVTAMGAHVGGFVGYSMVAASYTNCSSVAVVNNSSEYTGGFAGYSAGASTYTNCAASGDVSGTKHVGGFVGTAENSGFTDCFYTTGTVTENASGKAQSGGFCGLATTGVSFNGCAVKNASFLSNAGTYVGGFVGQHGNSYTGGNNVIATQCHVEDTSVTGSTNCGGFVGVQYDHISNSYVSGGSVTAKGAHCGGFSGFVQNGNLRNCYATTAVNGGTYAQVAGFAGIIYITDISYCYAAGSVSGSGSDRGAFIGKCDQQGSAPMADVSYCIGWDASLPLCGNNTLGASITHCYCGTDGTVSSQAIALSWPATTWDLSGSLPVLLDTPRRINAIFVGDSITWQWAVTSRTDNKNNILISIDPLPSYMTISGDNVTTRFHPGFFTANGYLDKGVSGQNTTQMLARFRKDVVDLNPVVTVIMAGTNDLAQGVTKEQIVANISAMAEMADAAGIKVVLCTVTPCNESYSRLSNPKTKGAHIITLNGMLKEYADSKGFSWCNYWSSLVADDGLALHPNYCLYDRLHPGPAGYDVMEAIIKPLIDSQL